MSATQHGKLPQAQGLRDDLDKLLADLAADARPRDMFHATDFVTDAPPLWALATQIEKLQALDIPIRSPKVGEAPGLVFHHASHTASMVWVRFERPREELGASTPSDPAGVATTTLDALRYALTVATHLYPHHVLLDPQRDVSLSVVDALGRPLSERDTIHGSSLGVTALLAAWSFLANTPLPKPVLATGSLAMTPGRTLDIPILDVGGAVAKAEEACALGDADLLLPMENLSDVQEAGLSCATGVAMARDAIGHAFGGDIDDPLRWPEPKGFDPHIALRAIDDLYWHGTLPWPALARRFEHLAHTKTLGSDTALAWARAGACYTHIEDSARAIEAFDRAMAIATEADDDAPLDTRVEVILHTHRAVIFRDLYRFDEATTAARRAVDLATRCRIVKEGVDARGALGQILVAQGEAREGLPLVEGVRDFYTQRHASESPRDHTYVVEALGRVGDRDACRHAYDNAIDIIDTYGLPVQAPGNRAYLDYAFLNAELRFGRRQPEAFAWRDLANQAANATERWNHGWPQAGLDRVSVAAKAWVDESAWRDLAGSIDARVADYRQRNSPIELWQEALGWIEVAIALTAPHTPDDAPIKARQIDAIQRVLIAPALEALPEAAQKTDFFAAQVANLGEAADPQALHEALIALIERAQY